MIDVDELSAELAVLACIGMELDKNAWIRNSGIISLPRYNACIYVSGGWIYTGPDHRTNVVVGRMNITDPDFDPKEIVQKLYEVLAPLDWPN